MLAKSQNQIKISPFEWSDPQKLFNILVVSDDKMIPILTKNSRKHHTTFCFTPSKSEFPFVHDAFCDDNIENLPNLIELRVKQSQKIKESILNDPPWLLIFDADIFEPYSDRKMRLAFETDTKTREFLNAIRIKTIEKEVNKNQNLKKIMNRGRHLNMEVILIVPVGVHLRADLRSQLDGIILSPHISNINTILKPYTQSYENDNNHQTIVQCYPQLEDGIFLLLHSNKIDMFYLDKNAAEEYYNCFYDPSALDFANTLKFVISERVKYEQRNKISTK